jgi:two-component SAPR family response regulator
MGHPRNLKIPYSCVIIDDDLIAINILKNYISRIDKLALNQCFSDAIEAMAAFRNYEKIDFLFLDIGMDISGLDIARMLRERVRYIIFTTAHSHYAIDAFPDGDGFLLKPIEFKKFDYTINQIIHRNSRDRKNTLHVQ